MKMNRFVIHKKRRKVWVSGCHFTTWIYVSALFNNKLLNVRLDEIRLFSELEHLSID